MSEKRTLEDIQEDWEQTKKGWLDGHHCRRNEKGQHFHAPWRSVEDVPLLLRALEIAVDWKSDDRFINLLEMLAVGEVTTEALMGACIKLAQEE